MPLRPLHDNDDGLEVIPAGDDKIKRKTRIGLMSVSPLDRLLNQSNLDDNIRVAISCYPRKEGMHPGETWTGANALAYDMNFKFNQVNTETCWNNLRPNQSQDCL